MKVLNIVLIGITLSNFISCTAKVYVIDRHTILEDEAAGEWPELEKEVLNKSVEKGPTPFEKAENNQKRKRLYNVLNGEMVSDGEKL